MLNYQRVLDALVDILRITTLKKLLAFSVPIACCGFCCGWIMSAYVSRCNETPLTDRRGSQNSGNSTLKLHIEQLNKTS
jgi:hypothetical protein